MKNLTKMTNDELNQIVINNFKAHTLKEGDFCNDWRLSGMLQEDLRISVNPYEDGSGAWSASTDTSFFCDDDCPKRAIVMAWITESIKINPNSFDLG